MTKLTSYPVHTFVAFFQEFYRQLVMQKHAVLAAYFGNQSTLSTQNSVTLPPASSFSPSHTLHAVVERAARTLRHVLEQQSVVAHQEGGDFASACYREAQYIMAVLADEIFLTLPWEGVKVWEGCLLEQKLFGTHVAGERFFKNLEQFLRERNPLKRDIGILYATALGLGFRGKFRGFDDRGKIATYKEKLFVLTYHHKPRLSRGESCLFEQTLDDVACRPIGKLVDLNYRRLRVFWVCVGMYFFCSWVVWYSGTRSLLNETRTIIEDARSFS